MIARIKTICAFGAISACAFANAYSAPGEGGGEYAFLFTKPTVQGSRKLLDTQLK